MPQEFHVLRCVSCETFQVHIVKKSKKWECKICGTKQSLKRNYGKGSGKDCRTQVMKLNEMRLTEQEIVPEDINGIEAGSISDNSEISNEPRCFKFEVEDCNLNKLDDNNKPFESKWDVFMDKTEESSEEEPETDFRWEVNSKKRKRSKNETVTSKKKIQNDFKLENDADLIPVNNKKLNFSESVQKTSLVQNSSKWGKYADFQDDFEDRTRNDRGLLNTEDENLDEILKL